MSGEIIKKAKDLQKKRGAAGALVALKAALKDEPDNIQVLLSLGKVYNDLGDFKNAVTALKRACHLAPRNPAILVPYSRALSEIGVFKDALTLAEYSITLKPDSIEALENAGDIYSKAGNIKGLINCLERLCILRPEEKRYYRELTLIYKDSQQTKKAYNTLKKFWDENTATAIDYAMAGEIAYFARFPEEAIVFLDKSLALEPDNPQGWTILGRCHSALGDKKAAQETYQKAVSGSPPFIAAYFYLSEISGFKEGDPAFATLEGLKDDETLNIRDKAAVGFALGRLYQGTGDFDQAFENFTMGNSNLRKHFTQIGKKFSHPELEQANKQVLALFSPENRKKLKFRGSKSKKPVFIIGLPRSGTTLLEQIMAAHSEISTAGELNNLNATYNEMRAQTNHLEGTARETALLNILDERGENYSTMFLETLVEKGSDTPMIIDKLPQNFFQLGLINVLFPNAKIIHMKRDPMAVGLSIYRSRFRASLSFANDLGDIGFYIRKYRELMATWAKVIDLSIHEVDYEALVSDPELVAKGVIEFCGHEWQPECLEFYKNPGKVFTASVIQVREPINRSAVDKWKAYEKHLGPLKKALEG